MHEALTKKRRLEDKRLAYVKAHSALSRSKIIDNWKGSGLAMQKQSGLAFIRKVRGQHIQHNITKSEAKTLYTPKKYKKVHIKVYKPVAMPEPDYYMEYSLKNKKTGKKANIKIAQHPHPYQAKRPTWREQILKILNHPELYVDKSFNFLEWNIDDIDVISVKKVDYKGNLFETAESKVVLG
jgi:hypothetical protein